MNSKMPKTLNLTLLNSIKYGISVMLPINKRVERKKSLKSFSHKCKYLMMYITSSVMLAKERLIANL